MENRQQPRGNKPKTRRSIALRKRLPKILIVDGYSVTRNGLGHIARQILQDAKVVEIDDFNDAIAIIAGTDAAQMVIVDFDTLETNTLGGIRLLRAKNTDVTVIVCSMIASRSYALQAIEAGAVAFIPKTAPTEEFGKAFEMVLAGGMYMPRGLSERATPPLADRMGELTGNGVNEARLQCLTRRQREVLGLVGQGDSNAKIAAFLGISEYTVRLHVSAILRKLDVSNRTQAAVLAQSQGLQQHI